MFDKNGITFEIGEQCYGENDDEEFSYNPSVQYSNDEILDMLNMNEFEDEEEANEDANERGGASIYGISFAKLKAKMTNLTPDGKVNQMSFLVCIVPSPWRKLCRHAEQRITEVRLRTEY